MTTLSNFLEIIKQWVWSAPLLILLVGTGVYLTVILKGLQFRYLWYSIKLAFTRNDDDSEGDISQFQALMTSMSAIIGIGSIAGVATAIAIGGIGAIFWMWVTGLVGLATKYAEAILAIKYRVRDEKGGMCGGPMYFLKRGLKWKKCAAFFAVMGAITALTTGNLVQSNSISSAVFEVFYINHWITGAILAVFTGLVLLKGIKSIGWVTEYLVPIMALLYLAGGIVILYLNYTQIPAGINLIFSSAFSGQAATGGFFGASLIMAIREGSARGVFSSESGLGSSPIAAAAAKTDHPGRQAMISMSGAFMATFIVCTITALVLSVTDVLGQVGADGKLVNGSAMVVAAFESVLTGSGFVVTIAVILFGYSTILGWAYYGEKCFEYLIGSRSIIVYRLIVTAMVLVGSGMSLEFVWNIADICNGLMALPNLLGLIGLAAVVKSETNDFIKIVKEEAIQSRLA